MPPPPPSTVMVWPPFASGLSRGPPGVSLAGAGEPEVRHLCRPVRPEKHVGGLHVPMDESLLVGVVQTPGGLDRHIEDRVGGGQAPVADGVEQAAAVRQLGEEEGEPEGTTHVVAGDDVGVQPEVDPGLRLVLEEICSARGLENGRQRCLDGEIESPAPVADAVDPSHGALAENAQDLVQPQDDLPWLPIHPCRAREGFSWWRGGSVRDTLACGGSDGPGLRHRRCDCAALEGRGGGLVGLQHRSRGQVGLEDRGRVLLADAFEDRRRLGRRRGR